MTSSRAIPSTGPGNAYRVLLVVAGLCAVVGIADAARQTFWLVLDAWAASDAPLMELVKPGLRLLAWGLVGLAAYTGLRRGEFPPPWILMSIPILCWALLLVQHYA